MDTTVLGLSPPVATAVFGLVGSLVGACAAISGQMVTQVFIDRREEKQAHRREKIARDVLRARVGSLAKNCDAVLRILNEWESPLPDAKWLESWEPRLPESSLYGDECVWYSKDIDLKFLNEVLKLLVRDYSNTELMYSLANQRVVEELGNLIPTVRKAVEEALAGKSRRANDPIQKDLVERAADSFKSASESADRMLKLLTQP